jgi:hypothetical protein
MAGTLMVSPARVGIGGRPVTRGSGATGNSLPVLAVRTRPTVVRRFHRGIRLSWSLRRRVSAGRPARGRRLEGVSQSLPSTHRSALAGRQWHAAWCHWQLVASAGRQVAAERRFAGSIAASPCRWPREDVYPPGDRQGVASWKACARVFPRLTVQHWRDASGTRRSFVSRLGSKLNLRPRRNPKESNRHRSPANHRSTSRRPARGAIVRHRHPDPCRQSTRVGRPCSIDT